MLENAHQLERCKIDGGKGLWVLSLPRTTVSGSQTVPSSEVDAVMVFAGKLQA